MTRVALIGSSGQLACDLIRLWPDSELAARGDDLVCLDREALDITDRARVEAQIRRIRPSLVINTAAFVRVDDCERDPQSAMLVNAEAPKYIAAACREIGATLVHFSTDYVFDGQKASPYLESDAASPLNAYGASKLAGELNVRLLLPQSHVIIRSSGLYGVAGSSGKGGNFVETMIHLAGEKTPISVVNDQVTCPTATSDLAQASLRLLAHELRGTFHVTNRGQCSWFEFASTIFKLMRWDVEVLPIPSLLYNAPAKRPAFSVLANKNLLEAGLPQPRPWQEALETYLVARGHLPAR